MVENIFPKLLSDKVVLVCVCVLSAITLATVDHAHFATLLMVTAVGDMDCS